jgi:hypothetical protein
MTELKYDSDGLVMHFRQELDMNDMAALREFLVEHPRYHTMHSWNRSTAYAQCVKLHWLPLTREQEMKASAIIECSEFWERVKELQDDFAAEHKFEWQTGFNGKSGGYIVLYRGGMKDGRPFTWPGRSVDMEPDMDFYGWDLEDFQIRAEFVLEFDKLCDVILSELLYYVENYDVKDEVVSVPKTVKRLVEKEAT